CEPQTAPFFRATEYGTARRRHALQLCSDLPSAGPRVPADCPRLYSNRTTVRLSPGTARETFSLRIESRWKRSRCVTHVVAQRLLDSSGHLVPASFRPPALISRLEPAPASVWGSLDGLRVDCSRLACGSELA